MPGGLASAGARAGSANRLRSWRGTITSLSSELGDFTLLFFEVLHGISVINWNGLGLCDGPRV